MSTYILNSTSSNGFGRDLDLLFKDVPTPLNITQQGQYSSDIASLNQRMLQDIAYPTASERPPIKELNEMQERDPVVQQCIQLKALRVVSSFGPYTHPKKEIESFINSNLNTITKSFKKTLFKIISSVILYGFCFAEYTVSNKVRGYAGQTRLSRLNPLDPSRIKNVKGANGEITFIEYDNGDGKTVLIPYSKCLHITNNSGAVFDEREIWGIGDGIAALNFVKLKRIVLTQLALATKNNSTGIVHARVPNNGRTVLVDSKMNPLKDASGKPIETTKQIALNYQLQDLHKKDFIVTDTDVDISTLQVQNDERFWDFLLNYIDRSIQRAFGIPIGIFDAGMGGLQNAGLNTNYKSVFDSTIFSLVALLKEEILNKIIRKLLFFNFPFDWFSNNFGDFSFDSEDDPATVNSRLSTIASLIASGILDANNIEVISLINKNLGLPALDEREKADKLDNGMKEKIQKEVQSQLAQLQAEMQLKQTEVQLEQLNNPQPAPQPGQPQEQPPEDYPEGA